MPIPEATRENVMTFLTEKTGISADKLTDDVLLGAAAMELSMVACMKFGKPIVVEDASTFSVGDFIAEICG